MGFLVLGDYFEDKIGFWPICSWFFVEVEKVTLEFFDPFKSLEKKFGNVFFRCYFQGVSCALPLCRFSVRLLFIAIIGLVSGGMMDFLVVVATEGGCFFADG